MKCSSTKGNFLVFLTCTVLLVTQGMAVGAESRESLARKPIVIMKTSEGSIRIELWPDKAPATVENFLRYADQGFYNGTIFHRVIDSFMIQGGGFDADMKPKQGREPIKNEASPELRNERGTIAMARTSVVDSATSQFFINVKDNDSLNQRDKTPAGFGYAVFGKVVDGMDVVDRIKKVQTATVGPYQNVPSKPVVIESVTRGE
jgi:cyclophilin family peptidyl-prolyl cis-trans isomerase